MSTIGQRQTGKSERLGFWRRLRNDGWLDLAAAIGLTLFFVALALGALFGAVFLVVLAVRLAWGAP